MGKQINYYMDYEDFVLVASKALELGCTIIREDEKGIVSGVTTDLITKDCKRYFFHVSDAGEFGVEVCGGKRRVAYGYCASGLTLIEAGYSYIKLETKRITVARLFCISSYYDEQGQQINRPDCVTKVYDSLARYVKKIAPRTEIEHYVENPLYAGSKLISHKYISSECLALVRDQDYAL